MNLLSHLRSGAKIVPPFLLVLYYLSVIMDLFTTWLASPDLKYEGNYIIRYFQLNWSQILILVFFNAIIISSFFLIGLNIIHCYYQDNSNRISKYLITEVFRRKKLLFCGIGVCCFYTHLFYSWFIVISNYLSYVYLFKIENILTHISTWYITRIAGVTPHIFTWYQIFFIAVAIIAAVYKVTGIRNKYRMYGAL